MKKTAVALFALFTLTSCGLIKQPTPTNELPLYGGIPRSAEEHAIDQEFINNVVKEAGSVRAAYQRAGELAWHHLQKRDYKTAIKRVNQMWLIEPDNAYTYNNFGIIYERQKKYEDAAHWYRIGAEKGDPKAAFNLAGLYYDGNGVKKDLQESARWIRIAADMNNNWAVTTMGVFYEHGIGVTQSYEEAKSWYQKADAHESQSAGPLAEKRGQIFKDLKKAPSA